MSGAANPVISIDPSEEDQDKLAEFESRIADGVRIEAGEWMRPISRSKESGSTYIEQLILKEIPLISC